MAKVACSDVIAFMVSWQNPEPPGPEAVGDALDDGSVTVRLAGELGNAQPDASSLGVADGVADSVGVSDGVGDSLGAVTVTSVAVRLVIGPGV